MSSDWNKRRRSGGDDRRPDREGQRPFARRDEERQGQRSFRQGYGDEAPRRGGFARDQRGGAPWSRARDDERMEEPDQGWRPFGASEGRDAESAAERRPSFRDRGDRAPYQERRFERRDADQGAGGWQDRGRDFGRPRDRQDEPPFPRRARDDDRFAGERRFGGAPRADRDRDRFGGEGGFDRGQDRFGGERRFGGDRSFNRRGDEGYVGRGERSERPSFGGREERPGFGARYGSPYGGRRDTGRERPFERQDQRPAFGRGAGREDRPRQGRDGAATERIQADVYGRWPVLEALRAGKVERIYLAAGVHEGAEHLREVQALATERDIPIVRVERFALEQATSGGNHQGVAAATRPFEYAGFDQVLGAAKQSESLPLIVVFDGVQDPQNLGSILRTAEAAGVQGVALPKHQQVGITPAVVRASAGAVEHLPVAQITNLRQSIEQLKEAGYWIVGLDMDGGTDYDNFDVDSPIALIVGGEGRGLGRLVAEQCDYLVNLPMRGRVGSLNASVASGIVLYEIQRRRDELQRRQTRSRRPGAAPRTEPEQAAPGGAEVTDQELATIDQSATGHGEQGEPSPGETEAHAEGAAGEGHDLSPVDQSATGHEAQGAAAPTGPDVVPTGVHEDIVEDLGDLAE